MFKVTWEAVMQACDEKRKPYVKPEITLDIELESRAGSGPLGMQRPLDLPEE